MPALVLGNQGGSSKALCPLRACCAIAAGVHVIGSRRAEAALLGAEAELALSAVAHLHNNGQRSCLQVTNLTMLWTLKQV